MKASLTLRSASVGLLLALAIAAVPPAPAATAPAPGIVRLSGVAQPSITISDASVARGSATESMLLTLSRTGDVTPAVTVAYSTTNGSAVAGVGYIGQSGPVTIPAHPTTATIAVATIDGRPDLVAANYYSDSVSVLLGDGSGGLGGSRGLQWGRQARPRQLELLLAGAVGLVKRRRRADRSWLRDGHDTLAELRLPAGGGAKVAHYRRSPLSQCRHVHEALTGARLGV